MVTAGISYWATFPSHIIDLPDRSGDRHGHVPPITKLTVVKILVASASSRLCWITENVRIMIMWRQTAPMDMTMAATILLTDMLTYSVWLTSIVFCSADDEQPLLIAAAAFFPVDVVHGIGVWLGDW